MRTAVAEALGAAVTGHTDLHAGMSPGPAAGLRLADGRHVFVKAVSAEVRAHNHRMILQEAAVLDVLRSSVPAPRRLATVEYGPWAVLVTTWAAGTTGTSWTDTSIVAVANACRAASAHPAPSALPPVAERIYDFDGWTRLLALGTGDDWEATHAGPAVAVAAGWEDWTAGDALVHRDLRPDNTTVGSGSCRGRRGPRGDGEATLTPGGRCAVRAGHLPRGVGNRAFIGVPPKAFEPHLP